MKRERTVRDYCIQVKVSKEERDSIFAAAQKNGMTLSAYCRWVLIQKEGNV